MIIFPAFSRLVTGSFLAVGLLTSQLVLANSNSEAELFKQIKAAYSEGSSDKFNRLSSQLPAQSIFRPYVDIWQFRFLQRNMDKQLSNQEVVWNKAEVLPLLTRHENSWPAETLRRDWLEQLARTSQWEEYARQRPQLRYRPDQGVECADLMHSTEQGQLVRYKLNAVLSSEKRLPKTCRVLLKNLYRSGSVSAQDLDRHVLQLVASNELGNAARFVEDFSDTSWGKALNSSMLREATTAPDKFLKNQPAGAGTDLYLAAALARRAIEDYPATARQIEQNYQSALSPGNEKWLWAHIGYRAGLVWDRNALGYFRRSSPEVMSQEQQEWKIRSALLLEDWGSVLQATGELSPVAREDKAWLYWRGRALAETGKIVEARQDWIRASSPFSFYGKLALEELGDTVTAPKRPESLSANELDWAKKHPGLTRALALYEAGLRTEGFWEFNLQVAQMTDRQLLATATWAERNQLYDRAIAAADRTETEHDLGLRYLTPFRENMRAKTREVGVDESWVYGLIRQESRFVTIARSGVGASGLMQVMPATAKYVANKIGLSNFKPTDINEIETNLTLGTSYLKMVFEQHDRSPVLASAGYNAGPSRPALWKRRLGDRKIEGAIFAELIPFDETRGYVKNVMSNTVAYSLLLNNSSTPLKQRLGIISGSK
ncbi:MAG TPA: transglycosylase SLT domain-containing protein [Limnobacter sp.]|nr:transglycosylase SLT domain-containing protein [Limnobacter sp.]